MCNSRMTFVCAPVASSVFGIGAHIGHLEIGCRRGLSQIFAILHSQLDRNGDDCHHALDLGFRSAVDYWIAIRLDFQNLSNLPGMHKCNSRTNYVCVLVASLSFG